MTKGRPGAGAALEQAIRDDLGANVELDPREEALLAAAVRQADDVAALEADVAERGHVVDGGLNPAVREVRQGASRSLGSWRGSTCRRQPTRPSCGPSEPLAPDGSGRRDPSPQARGRAHLRARVRPNDGSRADHGRPQRRGSRGRLAPSRRRDHGDVADAGRQSPVGLVGLRALRGATAAGAGCRRGPLAEIGQLTKEECAALAKRAAEARVQIETGQQHYYASGQGRRLDFEQEAIDLWRRVQEALRVGTAVSPRP